MTRTAHTVLLGGAALLALNLLTPVQAEAQRRGAGPQQSTAAPLVIVGVHGGYDDVSKGYLLGAQIRVPVAQNGRIEVVPSGSVTFITGLKEYQLNVDAAYTLGGASAGLYVAGGLAVRNTVFAGPDAETKVGFGLAGGIRSMGDGPVGIQIEFRQIFVDEILRPKVITLGLNFPLG